MAGIFEPNSSILAYLRKGWTMKVKVLPGQTVAIVVRGEGIIFPVIATVSRIQRGAIVLPEPDAINGLAKIVCHGASEENGSFWYEYMSLDGTNHQLEVLRMESDGGVQIFGPSFIED
jgi:hypothetical protein